MKRVPYFQLSIRFWDVEGSSTAASPQDPPFPLARDLGGVSPKKRCTDSLRGLPAPKVLDLTLSCLTGMGIGPLLAGNPSARRSVALLTPYPPG